MTKLHEILAVESTKEKAAKKLIKESLHTMNKESLFKGQTRRLEMFNEEDKQLETTEHQDLETTAAEIIDYVMTPVGDWLNVVLTKEAGNQKAVSNLEIGGKVILESVPATFLLGLEKKLIELRAIYDAIPTLAPGIKWNPDPQDREGVFVSAHDSINFKTKRETLFKTVSEATDKHPAQIAQVHEDINIGRYIVSMKSGMMTPLEKANRLSRIDTLLTEVKKARMRANNIDITPLNGCNQLLEYINKGSW